MSDTALWLFFFVGAYWLWCLVSAVMAAFQTRSATDFHVAGRQLSPLVFVLSVTAVSFSAWTFLAHPWVLFRDGFQYGYISLYAITIPLTGVLFFKRQWMLGRRFGFVTSGEMFTDYFGGGAIRFFVILIALVFAIPYAGIQFGASGLVFSVVSGGIVSHDTAMWLLALVVLLYIVAGGLRGVAYSAILQCVLMLAGLVVTGWVALEFLGGWSGFVQGLSEFAQRPELSRWHEGGDPGSGHFAMPGSMQLTAGLGRETPTGGLWTGVMCLTYVLALMGIQATPAFSTLAYSARSPRAFGFQQVVMSSLLVGGLLMTFTVIEGMGAHLLGANADAVSAGLAVSTALPPNAASRPELLVLGFYQNLAERAPWMIGFFAVCIIAAIQSTGAAHMNAAGSLFARDVYKRYVHTGATHRTQNTIARLSSAMIIIIALIAATWFKDVMQILGGLAVSWAFQLLPALAAVCWFPWLTRQGVTLGLAAGLIVVILTDSLGGTIASGLGLSLPWGRWPLTIYSGAWGMLANVVVVLLVSAVTQRDDMMLRRMKFHAFLNEHSNLPDGQRARGVVTGWILVLMWLIFGVGPGAVIGNTIFGEPAAGAEGWMFSIPSIWVWQLIWWGVGVVMMGWLAWRVGLSTSPLKTVEPLVNDHQDTLR